MARLRNGLRRQRLILRYLFQRGRAQPVESVDHGLTRKVYRTYDEYLDHQKSKLDTLKSSWLQRYDAEYRTALCERLRAQGVVRGGMNVLCLAARIGTEVKAFLDVGCFAVGLDLNPGPENRYVVYGDFHAIQYPDHCVDVVFTNSLDHALDLPRLLKEVRRVLVPGGHLILEVVSGETEGASPGYYEVSSWPKIDNLLRVLDEGGFQVLQRSAFDRPWHGEHVTLSVSNGSARHD